MNSIHRKALAAISTVILASCAVKSMADNPATTINIDAAANNHPISPYIYGLSWPSAADLSALNLPIARAGGENQSNYNWQVNATNLASDWYFESYPQASASADGAYDTVVSQDNATSAQSMITVPMMPYLAKLGANRSLLWSFSINKYGAQTGSDPYNPDAGNGISTANGHPNITGNNPLDAYVQNTPSTQAGMVQHLISTFGSATSGGVKYYLMDNEPAIWNTIHRDVHPQPESYDELYQDYIDYAAAVRNADPGAQIVGPEEWGWPGYFFSATGNSDYTSHGNMYAIPWLLQQLKNYQSTTGTQLLNVLSLHFYPQDGSLGSDDSAATQAIRNRSTRALWDPAYVDQSWIGQTGLNSGIPELIPLMQSWISQYYPGLGTAITEYNWGDDANLNGATTQGDILGIFGRENLTIGTRWGVPAANSPTYLSFEIYRNYDGNKSTFGDTSCGDTVANPDNLSSFAAIRSSDGALTVMVINKQTGNTPVTVDVANFPTGPAAHVYQISSATQTSINHLADIDVANSVLQFTVPSQSLTLLIVPPGAVTIPQPPMGLTATAGDAQVSLAWKTSTGATSYNVYRGTSSGGEATPIATRITNTGYVDTGLTNGTKYFYKVAAVNFAGTSGKSNEASATPLGTPTISSINPSSAPVGSPALTLTVSGAGFANTSVVSWNGVALATEFVSATQVTAQVPAADLAKPGSFQVTAANGSAISTPVTFTVTGSALVQGLVTRSSDGEPLEGVGISLISSTGQTFQTTTALSADGKSNYSLGPLTQGTYSLHVMGNGFTPASSTPISVTVPASGVLVQDIALDPGHTYPQGLQMFSAPGDFSAQTLASALPDCQDKIVTWDTGALAYAIAPSSPADRLRPGRAYWIRASAPEPLYGPATDFNQSQPYAISLQTGWNMVGDPFPVAVNIADFRCGSASSPMPALTLIAPSFYRYNSQSNAYESISVLQPYDGYWIYALKPGTLLVYAPGNAPGR